MFFVQELILFNFPHIITIYQEALVFELDMVILFQFPKILKKGWTSSQKQWYLFGLLTNLKNFFLYKSNWLFSIIYCIIAIYLEAFSVYY